MVTGASALAERPAEQLSGGEQQRLAIASVVSMGQRLLLLDEPTSQLDPVAAEELLGLVVRVNRDRGTTVVLAEHRTGRIFAEADRVIVMDAGPDRDRRATRRGGRRSSPRLAPWLLPPVAQAFVARAPARAAADRARARAAAAGIVASPPACRGPSCGRAPRRDGHGRPQAAAARSTRCAGADTGFGAGRDHGADGRERRR